MDLSLSLQDYLNSLSSSSPTPGGGNVSALCGVLAAALGQMVCALTIGKKKYHDFEENAKKIHGEFIVFQNDLLELARKDNEAFDKVMEAFKLPKETEEQKSFRREAIDKATLDAAVVPAEVISKCGQMLPLIEETAEKGNQNSLSDAGVAISLISTAAAGAFMNVAINCSGLTNQITAGELMKKSEITYNEIKEKTGTLISGIIERMRNQ